MGITSYKDLVAWQKAFQLGLAIYRVSGGFPPEERFCLTVQIRRSAVSVASNVAEGFGRGSGKDYLRFLRVARGSLYEVETQLLFAVELGYLESPSHAGVQRDVEEVGRLLGGLIRSVEQRERGNQR